MKTLVDSNLLNILPVHDADFISMEVVPALDGDLKLCLVFKLHPDELLNELSKLGIVQRSLRLTCEKCWRISSNIFGVASNREAIDNWKIVKDSELIKHLKAHGLANGVELQHHRIEMSGGSSLDVLTEEASIEEYRNANQ
jgi:hypothetical protein